MSTDTAKGALPKGWRQLALKDACELITDGSHFSPTTVEKGIPYITVRDLGDSGIDFMHCKFVTRESFLELARSGCQPFKNDVLFSKDGTVGKVALVNDDREFVVLSSLAIVRPNQETVSSAFLKLSMQSPSFLETALGLKTGTALRRIVLRNLKTVSMAVPPLSEQEKIVEILEEQLSHLDAALASVNSVREKAARFRLSLLHAAFTGALTGHDSSKEAIPESWALVELEALLSVSIGGIWGEESGLLEVDVDVVRVTELKAHGVIEPSTAAKRSITRKQFESRALQVGDLLLEKSGGGPNTPVGRVGYVSSIDKPTVCSNFMQLMRPDMGKIRPVFLHLFLTFIHSKGETIPMQTSTTNIRNIKTPQYMASLVPCPQLDEQETIIAILDEQLSRLDSSLAIADLIEKKALAMRRSLLHAAFTGVLTKEWRVGAHV
jgi:type I restriction enzyme S subunit